jgi:hypothetical protein
VAGTALFAAAAFVALRFYGLAPVRRPAQALQAPTTPEAIERGRYLVNHVLACGSCHSETLEHVPGDPIKPGRFGSGRNFGRLPGFPGDLRAPNLTPHADGLGTWTTGEVVRAIREGIARDGRPLSPFMPYANYGRHLSDPDVLAVAAYLKTLAPLQGSLAPTQMDFPVGMFVRTLPRPVESPAAPLPAEPVARGERLLELAGCVDCHDAFDDRHQPLPGRRLAGGMAFSVPGKGSVYAPNLTPNSATGIGAFSDEDLMKVFRTGLNRKGRALYVMPWSAYSGLTDEDARALIAALRKLAPVSNPVPAPTFRD